MIYQHLLDTNILSDVIRHTEGRAAKRLREFPKRALATSLVVAGELQFGGLKVGNRELSERISRALDLVVILPVEQPVDEMYGRIRSRLERIGRPIGHNDLWIAAHALALDLTLVTDNVDEFSRVEGLRVENWLR